MASLEGKKAPAFSLPASTGAVVALKDSAGKPVVLYFYPRDSTPGCTMEAQDFQAALPALGKLGAAVLGVSRDSIASHCRFADKHGLGFPLLSDADGAVLAAYGAWGEKTLYGRRFMGIIRTTVLIGPDGKVARVWAPVKVKGHADAVLEAVRGLGQVGAENVRAGAGTATVAAKASAAVKATAPVKATVRAKAANKAKPAVKAKARKAGVGGRATR